MPCYHPIYMHYSTKGPKPNGKKSIVSGKSIDAGKQLALPCGRCIGCRLERSRQWAVRCMHESHMHEHNEFLTLTYRDSEIVYGGAEHGILVPRHLTLFLKRLRKRYGKGIKYFGCGEYGDQSNRPHYHAVVFGLNVEDKTLQSTKNGINYYRSDSIDDIWSHGNCIIGDVTFESCAYVARYVMKKRLGNTADTYDEEGITPEFVRMSRGNAKTGSNGIGNTWLKKYLSDVYPVGSVVVNGHESKPPKYYDNKYELIDPVKLEQIKNHRAEIAKQNYDETTTKRLNTKERVKLAAIKSLIRPIS